MNNIINVRLGHYVLAVDADAAEILRKYSAELQNRYDKEHSANEIVEDIEERIGELLQEKQKNNHRTFTTLEDVTEVLEQMGPATILEEGTPTGENQSKQTTEPIKKRMYRDPDNRILGGVWSGFGNYFDLDPLIFRLLWVVSVFVLGFGIPLYIILWVIIPTANTTAEKLMMRGQRPTLKNIEENAREEFRQVEEKLNSGTLLSSFGSVLKNILEFIGKFLIVAFKIVLAIVGIVIAISLVGLLILFTTNAFHLDTSFLIITGQQGLNTLLSAAADPFLLKVTVVAFLLLAIAFVVLQFFAGNRKSDQMRTTKKILGITLLVLFLTLGYFTLHTVVNFSHKAEKDMYSEIIPVTGDTLTIKTPNNALESNGFFIINRLDEILPSTDGSFRIEQKNIAMGSSYLDATNKTKSISKFYTIEKNTLSLMESNAIKDIQQKGFGWVKFILYVPAGKTIRTGNTYYSSSGFSSLLTKNQTSTMDSAGFFNFGNATFSTTELQSSIENLEISGNFEVQLIQSNKNSLELLSGPIVSHSSWISHSDSKLTIESEDYYNYKERSVIRIHMKKLQRIDISSTSIVWLRNWNANNLEIDCSGASRVKGRINLERLDLDVSGASEAEFSGTLEKMKLQVQGVSYISCKELRTKTAEADISGASKATLWVTERINAEVSGASNLYGKGHPPVNDINTNGASSYDVID